MGLKTNKENEKMNNIRNNTLAENSKKCLKMMIMHYLI